MVNRGLEMIRDCGALRFTDAAAKAHAALVQRAAAVLSSYGADGEVMLADAFEGAATDPRRTSVLLVVNISRGSPTGNEDEQNLTFFVARVADRAANLTGDGWPYF